MRKFLFFMLALMFTAASAWAQTATPPSGSGAETQPFLIETLENLVWVADQVNNQGNTFDGQYIKQTANIDASDTENWDNGGLTGWDPIGRGATPFKGTYDGDHHTIDGLFMEAPFENIADYNHLALFLITQGSTIKNLGLTNVDITGNARIAALVALHEDNSIIDNCYSTGTITAGALHAGGLVALNDNSTILNSYSECSVESYHNRIGGLIGESINGTVENSFSTGNITGFTDDDQGSSTGGLIGQNSGTVLNSFSHSTVTGRSRVGGLIGENSGIIIKSYSTGDVEGIDHRPGVPFDGLHIGGLVGRNMNNSNISNSYSRSKVTGIDYVGGLVGENNGATITVSNCYSTGLVICSGTFVGGLIGNDPNDNVTNSYWDTETSDQTTSAGGTGAMGKTTEQMQDQATYASWDFDDTWRIFAAMNDGYPELTWQDLPPVKLIRDDEVISLYQTIQAAYADAIDNDVIKVAAGEFSLTGLTINKSITLEGNNAGIPAADGTGVMPEGRLAETVLTVSNEFWPHADNITIDGFHLKSGERVIRCQEDANNLHIINNILESTSGHETIHFIGSGNRDDLLISNNRFIGHITHTAVLFSGADFEDALINENDFIGDFATALKGGVDGPNIIIEDNYYAPSVTTGINMNMLVEPIIRNNTFDNLGYVAIQIGSDGGLIEDNYIDGAETARDFGGEWGILAYGITVFGDAWGSKPSEGLIIRGNTIKNIQPDDPNDTGTWNAISIGTNAGPNITIEENILENNFVALRSRTDKAGITLVNNALIDNTLAVYNVEEANILDATCNWWGQDTGPEEGQVSEGVDASLWLSSDDLENPVCIGPVYNVTRETYHNTIQAAIDAAVGGDEIEVDPGTFAEPNGLQINKSLTINGAGEDQTIVEISRPSSGYGIRTSSDHELELTFTNMTFEAVENITNFFFHIAHNKSFTMEDVTVIGMGKDYYSSEDITWGNTVGGVDMINLENGTLTNVTVKEASRNAISFSAVKNITMTDFTVEESGAREGSSALAIYLRTEYPDNNPEMIDINGGTITGAPIGMNLGDTQLNVVADDNIRNVVFTDNSVQAYASSAEAEALLANNTFDRAVVVRGSDIKVPVIFSSIPAAIEVAGEGDLVDVREGEYDGFRIPGKVDLTIKGTGDVTIIPVNISGETAGVYIDSETTGLVIDGFKFDGEGTATPNRGIIGIDGSEYLVKSSTFKNLNTGVYSNGTGSGNVQLTVQDNTFMWCVSAIGGTEATDPLVVTGNTFENNRNGIGIANDTDGIVISGNTFEIEDIDEVETHFGGNARYVSNRGNLQGEPAEDVIENNTFDPEARFALSGNNTTNIVPVGSGEISPVEIIVDGVATGGYETIQDAVDEAEAGDQISIGSGSYVGTVISPGNIVWSYGASPGCVEITGSYTYQSTDIVEIDIWGDDPFCGNEGVGGNEWYDQIIVVGTATLNQAKLDINLYNDIDDEWYNPPFESEFTILISETLVGNFMEWPGEYVRAKYQTGHKNFAVSYDNNEVVLTTLEDRDIDIAINELGCAGFEVVLIPRHNDVPDQTITFVQFTIKYPEAVELTNLNPLFDLADAGYTVPAGDGYKYITYVGNDLDFDGGTWAVGEEVVVLTFNHNQSGQTDPETPVYGDFTILSAEETGPEFSFYVEYLGMEVSGDILTEYDNDDPRVIGLLSGCPVHNTTRVYPVGSDPEQFDLYYYHIQDAISGVIYPGGGEIAGAEEDDVLEAATWTFVENVVVDVEGVTLQPMTDAVPVIEGDGEALAVVIIEADKVILTGFTVQNSHIGAPGIAIAGASECLVEENLVQDNGIGIAILATDADANENIIRGNTITENVVIITGPPTTLAGSTGYGVYLGAYEGSDNAVVDNFIENNTISKSKDGIYIAEDATGTEVTGNLVFENYRYGIHLVRSDANNVQGNSIYNNGIVGNLQDADPDTQTARNTAGIRISQAINNTIFNNKIYNEAGTGGNQVKGIRLFTDDQGLNINPEGTVIINNSILGHNEGISPFDYNLDAHGIDVSPLLDVTCNWWGTADINDVLAGIRGAEKVVYLPLLINDDEETEDPDWPNGFNPIGPCEAPITLTVFLQGPYDEDEMKVDLNGLLPTTQPYSQFPWSYPGNEELPETLSGDEVDWVLVELRDSNDDEYWVIERFAGLLNKDGSITASFTVPLTEFYVVVYHRNHLPVMFEDQIVVSDFTFPVDLTVAENVLTGSAIDLGDGVFGMVAGDVLHNGRLAYSGPGNDRGPIIARLVNDFGATSFNAVEDPLGAYLFEDVLMNNILSYVQPPNDRGIIIANITALVGPHLNMRFSSPVPGFGPAKSEYFNDGPVHILAEANAISIRSDEAIKDGLVDNIQFTLAWQTGDEIAEQAISNMKSTPFLLKPQGEAVDVNGISHLVMVSINPTFLPAYWAADDAIELINFTDDITGRLWIAQNEYTMDNNAMYYVSVWGSDHTGEIVTQDDPTGTGDITGEEGLMKLYPNPVNSGQLFVELHGAQGSQVDIAIYDIRGTLVKRITETNVSGTLNINVTGFAGGIYYLRATASTEVFTDKFIIAE